jgi:hypothetical protein
MFGLIIFWPDSFSFLICTHVGNCTLRPMQLDGADSFFRNSQFRCYSRIFQYFIEPEILLACLQQLSTGPYPEPDYSSPYHPIHSL